VGNIIIFGNLKVDLLTSNIGGFQVDLSKKREEEKRREYFIIFFFIQ